MADVKGGRGVTGMSFSGKGNLEKPSSGKLARELGSTVSKTTSERTSGSYPRIGFGAITPPGTSSRMLAQKFSTKYTPGEYAAYRQAMSDILTKKFVTKKPAAVVKPAAKKLATVVSNVTNEKLSPAKAAPRGMAINPRTGNTTGFTTGKTTGTSVSKPGVAGKTYQSAGDRMKATTERRFGEAGPTSSSRSSGGSSRSSSTSSSSSSRSGGGGNLGGARGRISEPGGSKR